MIVVSMMMITVMMTVMIIHLAMFFLSGFSSTDTDDSQDSRGREGTTFYSTLPLYQFHPLTNIETFICNFA